MEDALTTRRRFISASALLLGGAAAHTLVPTAEAQDGRVAQDIAVLNSRSRWSVSKRTFMSAASSGSARATSEASVSRDCLTAFETSATTRLPTWRRSRAWFKV